jgi:DNA-binding transcriptional regulator YhcF (GntR family)
MRSKVERVSKRRGAEPLESNRGLELEVDRAAEIPIGVQLAWALRSRIAEGALAPGQKLPGLRELAKTTGVNVNTVRAVYQRLEQERLIDSHQGSGTFVALRPPRASPAASIAADAAREAHDTGVDPREVAAALYVAGPARAASTNAEADRRRALREQIAALERTLGELLANHPSLAIPTQAMPKSGPALLSAMELERVRAQLVRRLSAVQSAIDKLERDASAARSKRRAANLAGEAERSAPAGKPARASSGVRPAPAGA